MELHILSYTFFLLFLFLVAGQAAQHHHHHHHHHHHRHHNHLGFRPTKLFVFGDSYSDTGNNPKSLASSWKPPYGSTFPGKPTGRYSDGRVLTDYLARFMGIKSPLPYKFRKYAPSKLRSGLNFAYGGTGVFDTGDLLPNMSTQIGFLQSLIKDKVYTNQDLKSSLALVTVSGNDYSAYTSTTGSQQGLPLFIPRVVNQMAIDLKRIHDMGIRRVLVTTLQPIGCLPKQTVTSSYQHCNKTENLASNFHNQLLQQVVTTLNNNTKDSSFIVLDTYSAFNTVLNSKTIFSGNSKFDTPLKPCCVATSSGANCGSVDNNGKELYTVCNEPESVFFWDMVHPTQAGWRAVYLTLRSSLNQILQQSDGYIDIGEAETRNCEIKLRVNPVRRREEVFVGCGAGFGGDRPLAALKLLQKVNDLDYLVLECLAERTLADRYQAVMSGGEGFDPRISEWMQLLLPLAVEKGVCIITNMGATNALAAQEKVLEIASRLGVKITVGVAHQFDIAKAGLCSNLRNVNDGISMYLGAAPIVECLEKYNPNVVITSRVADAALFLAPMVYELGWNWDEYLLLAQGSLAGHLLECGCQLTGGYFMHPGDKYRDISCANLLDLSLPFAEISYDGKVCVAKADGSGGVLNFSTCAQQLLYEVGDPGAYFTPDVVIDFQDVSFHSLSTDKVACTGAKPAATSVPDNLLALASKEAGWKGWGEISYGGYKCVERAKVAEFLVKSWMEEVYPGTSAHIMSYIIGLDSLKAISLENISLVTKDIRLRMDGLFEQEKHAIEFTKEFTALYTNGPAGGGGISTGHKKEILLEKGLVGREHIYWKISAKQNQPTKSNNQINIVPTEPKSNHLNEFLSSEIHLSVSPAPSNQKVHLYDIAHSRAGDKGNDINFSIIPHFPPDVKRLKTVITPDWVKRVISPLLNQSSFPKVDDIETRDKWVDEHVTVEVYEVRGISSLNVVVRNILDGGVNCSRRIDRHGKTISDLILCQEVVLPM